MRNLFNEAFHSPDAQIWVFDGQNAKAARKEIYPMYKGNRVPGSDEFYKTMDVFRELLKLSNKFQIRIKGYEGDDVIANLIRSSPGQRISLHANDGDFHVLCNELVTMTHPALPKVSNEDVRLYKTLVGDPGDFIPGIKGFGKGAWDGLQEQMKARWVRFFEENPWESVIADGMYPSLINCPSPSEVGLKDKSYDAIFQENGWRALTGFWRIVGFLDISPEVMNANMIIGVPDYPRANIMLKGIMQ